MHKTHMSNQPNMAQTHPYTDVIPRGSCQLFRMTTIQKNHRRCSSMRRGALQSRVVSETEGSATRPVAKVSEGTVAQGQAPPRPAPRAAGRGEVEEQSRTDSGRSGGQHLEAKPLIAPSNGPHSSHVTDPRAGSEARWRGARSSNGIGERERALTAASVAESSGAWTGAAAEAAE